MTKAKAYASVRDARAAVSPTKSDSPVVVDPDAVLPASLATELLEPVPRRSPQVVQILGTVQYLQLSFA